MTSTNSFLFSCLVFVFIAEPASVFGLSIRFYEGYNNTGYYHEVNSFKGECDNLDSRMPQMTFSYKTDTCIMVFYEKDCTGFSEKVLPGSKDARSDPLAPMEANLFAGGNAIIYVPTARSFFPCNKKEGGHELNVDVSYENQEKYEFKNICGCRNLPLILHDKSRSVSANNHGNPFKVYTETDCGGDGQVIPAGNNYYSMEVTRFQEANGRFNYHPVRSIGPSRNSLSYKNHCLKLASSIFKFEFVDNESEDEVVQHENVEMAQKTVFVNNGTAKLTQEYKVVKKVTETIEVQVVKAVSNMHKVTVEDKVTVDGGIKIKFLAEAKVKNEFRLAYEWQRTSTDTNTEKNVTTISKEFSIRQQIEILPCTEYTMSSYVVMMKDQLIPYKVYSKITGELGDDRMTAKQIRDNIEWPLQVVEDLDGYTVVVTALSAMKVNYGIKAMLSGQGTKIMGCEMKK